MGISFTKINRQSVTESIVEALKQKILNGEISSGDKLPSERDLAESFGVSRASVREAMRALRYMGVLEVHSGEGTFLTENISLLSDHFKISLLLKQCSVKELVEARKIIECETVSLATIRSSKEEKDALKKLHKYAMTLVDDEQPFLKADFDFHEKIAEMSQNMVLVEMLNATRDLTLSENMYVIEREGQIKRALDFHSSILYYILSFDADNAQKAMLAHLEDIERSIRDFVSRH